MPALTWSVRSVDHAADGEAVYRELFAAEPVAFWLDGGLTDRSARRISVLGTSAGPDAEVLVRDVTDGDVFTELQELLAARRTDVPAELADVFSGGYVGYFGYELKALTGGAAAYEAPTPDALWIWANRFVVIDHDRGRSHLVAVHAPDDQEALDWLDRAAAAATSRWMGWVDPPAISLLDVEQHLEQDRATYLAGIDACRVALEAGDTYEVCLTNRVRLPPVPDPLDFYLWQRATNPAPYAAFLRYGEIAVASSSPERFLAVDADGWAECRPIKGTAPRSADPAQDQLVAKALAEDEKTRAENLMIVDLIRNDLGRVSEPGSVQVPQLMVVESYQTMHQLVTTVRGKLRAGVGAVAAVRACFPPGSMTGAPKIRTMELLDELEPSARGVYSGVLGYLTVDGRADLSVVIRTAVLTPRETVVGAGGAIVLDSEPVAEYDEMVLKATATLGRSG
ncbi:para-aminobenzoate synthase, subunit I [Kribbella flavida DSM 17836]|uniref:aminodeoxychorismate synthase n=1 Tax=Kribbella flavida (strain DSM 17836 / JCM 10339 / NBRC 14399) TaxID=479435 RepID=D2PRF5_KRIFD|nr:aminodeoxychorismate synthase component I [Kribbella flavida]ADB34873.1 para-aminobenzoate synthase, subunit I [Kribbella flavida DSM 17836]